MIIKNITKRDLLFVRFGSDIKDMASHRTLNEDEILSIANKYGNTRLTYKQYKKILDCVLEQ